MQKIEILSAEVQSKKGTSTKTGKPYEMREQAAALHDTNNRYPQAIRWQLGRDQAPYPVGMYEIDSPLAVGAFERVQLARDVKLVAVKTAKAA